jgi:very-short-patch-repair endonuclease
MTKHKIIPYAPHLKPLAKELRKNMTFAEVLLWNELKAKQLLGFDFHRQKPLDQFIVDFYCKELRLAIEVDGLTHQWEEVQVNDKKRQERLERLGVHFLRFDDDEVINDRQNVLRVIEAKVRELSKE